MILLTVTGETLEEGKMKKGKQLENNCNILCEMVSSLTSVVALGIKRSFTFENLEEEE